MTNEQAIAEDRQLQTNLAVEVLEKFMNLKARTSIGMIYLDLQRALGDTKLAVEKFERSSDNDVCPYLTELIRKVMFYYELILQYSEPRLSPLPYTSMEKIVSIHFPDMPKSIIHGHYDPELVISSCYEEVGRLTEELHEILNKPIKFNTLKLEKITTLYKSKPNKKPKYNASRDKNSIGVLAILLGTFGIHKFLLGYNREGLIMLGVSSALLVSGHTAGFVGVVSMIEGIIYMSKSNEDFTQIYVSKKRGWF